MKIAYNQEKKTTLYLAMIVGGLLAMFAIIILLAPKASAASYYPYDKGAGGEHKTISSSSKDAQGKTRWEGRFNCGDVMPPTQDKSGRCNTGLNAQAITYKLFATGGKPVGTQLQLWGACKNVWGGDTWQKPGRPNKGSRVIRVEVNQAKSDGSLGARKGPTVYNANEIFPNSPYDESGDYVVPSGNCAADGTLYVPIDADAFTANESYKYGNGVYTALVTINKQPSTFSAGGYLGEDWFQLNYPAGQVYGDDYGYYSVGSTNVGGESDFVFQFKPDCSYQPGTSVPIKITDIDWFSILPQKDPNLTVKDENTGQIIYSALPKDEGRDSYTYTIPPNLINKDHKYTLRYTNIRDNNGLKINLPFSEYTKDRPAGSCPIAAAATCSIQVFGDPKTGDPNGVEGGRQFNVNVTIRNNGTTNIPLTYAVPPKNRGVARWTDSQGVHNNRNPSGYYLSTTLADVGTWGAPDGITGVPPYNGIGPVRVRQAYPTDYSIAPGSSRTRTITLTAPNDQASRNITMYPDYWGKGGIGPECNGTVNSYQRFDFSATSSTTLEPTPESPAKAKFTNTITQNGVPMTSTSTRTFKKKEYGMPALNIPGLGPYNDGPRSFGNATYNDEHIIIPGSFKLGDRWCTELYMPYGKGWVSSAGTQVDSDLRSTDCQDGGSASVTNKPYIRTYGSDTAAGGGFGTNCDGKDSSTGSPARVLSWLMPLNYHQPGIEGRGDTTNKSGSGSELATMATGQIGGFRSVTMRNAAPTDARGLTFANLDYPSPPADPIPPSASIDKTIDNPVLGGYMSGKGWCVPNYYQSTQFPESSPKKQTVTSASLDVKGRQKEGQTVVKGISKLNLSSSADLEGSDRHTIYVDGDVSITGPIKYKTSYPSTTGGTNNIPSFTLVVRGNIYIDKNVRQLDGLYIAQPKEGQPNTGRIYTCADGGNPVTLPAAVYSICGADTDVPGGDKRLTVNGSFIAQRVVLNRVSYSIGNSTYQEKAGDSKAAEIFNFTPEIYLSPPVFASRGDVYNYIAILAPIL